MRGRHKKWAVPFLTEHPEICLPSIDLEDPFFSLEGPLYLEIGMGKGDFLLGMAAKHPGHYLGLERDLSILGLAGKKILASEVKNIRVYGEDFDLAYEELQGLRFDGIYLNFSDPWPKRRHWKRRLTTATRLNLMAGLLAPNGRLYMKTDNDALFEFTLEQIPSTPFEIVVKQEEYAFDEEHDVQSEYEANFRSQGKPIHRLILIKKGEKPCIDFTIN